MSVLLCSCTRVTVYGRSGKLLGVSGRTLSVTATVFGIGACFVYVCGLLSPPPLSSLYLNPPPTFCLTCSDGVLVGYSCGATAVLPSFWGGAHALTLAHGSHAKRCHFTLIDEHVRQA